MAKVIIDTKIYYKGQSQTIPAGTVYPDNATIVLENKEKFVFDEAPKKVEVKKEAPKKVEVVEELKEELLVESPVSVLDITEE